MEKGVVSRKKLEGKDRSVQGQCIHLKDTVEKNNFTCKWSRKKWNNSFKISFSNKKGKQKEVSQLGGTGDMTRITISHGWIRKFF